MERKTNHLPLLDEVQRLPLFASCTQEEITDILTRAEARIRTLSPHEIVVHEGLGEPELVFVRSGRILVYTQGRTPVDRNLAQVLTSGQTFGASIIHLGSRSNPATLVAAEKSEVLILNALRLKSFYHAHIHPDFLLNLSVAAAQEWQASWNKLAILHCYETRDRINLFHQLGHVPLPPGEFAAYLGINRTALYRVLKRP